MQKKIKRLMFVIAILLFLFMAVMFIVYSWGYRWNQKEWKFVKTGGLYLRVYNSKPEIYLNNQYLKKATPGLLSNGIFLSNLIPDNYLLKISKPNYFSWEKEVVIEPQMVTTFSSIVLLPKNPLSKSIYSSNETSSVEILDILPLKNGKELIIQAIEEGTSTSAVLFIYNFNNQNQLEIYRKKINKGENFNLISNLIIADNDANQIIFPVVVNKTTNFYLWERINPENIKNISQTIISQFKFKNPIKKIDFYPNTENKYIILTGTDLMLVDLNKNEMKKIFLDVKDFARKDYNMLVINNQGAAFSYNLILDTSSPLGILELEKENSIKKIQISPKNNYYSVQLNNGDLYLLKSGEEITLLKSISLFAFSNDDKKLAYINKDNELHVKYLTDFTGDFLQKKGEDVLIKKLTEPINNLICHSDLNHLIYQSENKIYFAEIDVRDAVNIFELNFNGNNFYLEGGKNGTIFTWNEKTIKRIDLLYEQL
ncbi:MAG: hypothetical protein N2692_01545 [Patescibacteria group bacterium]|jgi:hypothetical protein|nr:hypothetical protein [Patescibacteria group bacterium]